MKKAYYRRPITSENKIRLIEIGHFIYLTRIEETGLSRRDFAIEFDIPHTVLQRIENGGNYEFISLLRVIDALNLDLQTVMYGM